MTGSSSAPWRRALGVVLAVLAAVLLSFGVVAIWAIDTFFDADAFSERAVQVLDSEAARRELAIQLTDQLAQRGNREVIAFRPAAQLTIEAVIDTDTFRSIFATAVKRLHAGLITGTATSGLDLSDSLALLSSSLQLSQGQAANPGDTPNSSVVSDALDRVGRLPVWGHRDGFQSAALLMAPLGILAATASVMVAADRRRALRRVGFALIGAGAGLFAVVIAATLATAKFASDDTLEAALRAAAWSISVDLRTGALGIAAAGIVILAASDPDERFGPRHLADRFTGWVERMQTSAGRTLVLATVVAAVGVSILNIEPATLARAVTAIVGLTLLYAAVRLVVGMLPTSTAPARRRNVPIEAGGSRRAQSVSWSWSGQPWCRSIGARRERPKPSSAPASVQRSAAISDSTRSRSPVRTTRCRRSSTRAGCSRNRSNRSARNSARESAPSSSTRTTASNPTSTSRDPSLRSS